MRPKEFTQNLNTIVRGFDFQLEPEGLFEDSTHWVVKPQERNVFRKKDFSHFLRSFLYSKNNLMFPQIKKAFCHTEMTCGTPIKH